MHPIIEETYRTASPDLLRSAISPAEGALLQRLLSGNDLKRSIEVGCDNGLSSLFIFEELAKKAAPQYKILDPFQLITLSAEGEGSWGYFGR
jgi:predicted O-methyltransferase YrrM